MVYLWMSLAMGSAVAMAEEAPDWDTEPYVRPRLGVVSFVSEGNTNTTLRYGLEGGLRYSRQAGSPPTWRGQLRGIYDMLASTNDLSGTEIRVGNFIGPWWGPVGLASGPDVFWNQYSFAGINLDPAVGLAWPVNAYALPGPLMVFAGVEPAWYLSGDREPVNWSETDAFGFGDAFTVHTGVSVDAMVAKVGLSWSRRTTAYGTEKGLGLSLRLGL